MKELKFDENFGKNKVIDELIFNKIVFGILAYTWYEDTYYDNSNIELLKSLKDVEPKIRLSLEEVKEAIPDSAKKMINKVKLTLEPKVGDELEDYCYNLLRDDLSLASTIQYSCYILCLIQLGKDVSEKLQEIIFIYSTKFDLYVARDMILKFTDKKTYSENVFAKYIKEKELMDNYNKIIKISNKIF